MLEMRPDRLDRLLAGRAKKSEISIGMSRWRARTRALSLSATSGLIRHSGIVKFFVTGGTSFELQIVAARSVNWQFTIHNSLFIIPPRGDSWSYQERLLAGRYFARYSLRS
jgi:hypothetical protein